MCRILCRVGVLDGNNCVTKYLDTKTRLDVIKEMLKPFGTAVYNKWDILISHLPVLYFIGET